MIYQGSVPLDRQISSRKNYNYYCLVNGLSYMCLGETVLILLAVKIGSPDYIISTLGAMVYIGFLLLPLGKMRCGKIGAAMSLADFWVARNMAALLVALAAALAALGFMKPALALLLIGAFLFYGFRAAGVVLSQPLIGTITNDRNRARLLGVSNGLFYISCVIALLAVSFLLRLNSSVWVLVGVVITGSFLGVGASTFIRKIDEEASLCESARKPLLPELRGARQNRTFVKQLGAVFCCNLSLVMLAPISVAALKRGCGISDSEALMYTLLQFGASAIMSFFSGRLNTMIGPRRSMLAAYSSMLLVAFLWLSSGAVASPWRLWLIFFLIGVGSITMNNAAVNYYLQTISASKQVAYSIIVAIVTNVGAGLAGMVLAGGLLWYFVDSGDAGSADVFAGYRKYFTTAFFLLGCGILPILRLTPLSGERRRRANAMQPENI